MDLYQFVAQHLLVFLLVLARISGLFVMAPVFSNRNIPVQVKAGLAALLSLILVSTLNLDYRLPADSLLPLILTAAAEFITGLVIGFAAQLIFAAVQAAGEGTDMQMGFGIVNVVDPLFGTQVPLIGNFKLLLALLVYLEVNGHHLLLVALRESYLLIPIGGLNWRGSVTATLLELFTGMFILALKIMFPVVGGLLVVEIALGLLARAVPQMNVFIVGLAAKVGAGLILLLFFLPVYVYFTQFLVEHSYQDVLRAMRVMAGK